METTESATPVDRIVMLFRELRDDLKGRVTQAQVDAGTAYENTVPRDAKDPSVRYFIGAAENLSDFLVKLELAVEDAEKIEA